MIFKIATISLIVTAQLFGFAHCSFAERAFTEFIQFKEKIAANQPIEDMKLPSVFKFLTVNKLLRFKAFFNNAKRLGISGGDDKQQEPNLEKSKPKFCNGLDCPDFEVVAKNDVYEERLYYKSSWVSTSMTGMAYKDAQSKMFRKLFNYIQGQNEAEKKIAMTCPVINRLVPGAGPACESNFTMSFFVADSLPNPPQPSDKTVFLSSLPRQKVFVRYFSGFAYEKEYVENAKALGEALQRDGKKFDDTFFYSAGYDNPFKPLNRHNEVWFEEVSK